MISLPPSLQSGDAVALLAPSGSAPIDVLRRGRATLEKLGLRPLIGRYATSRHETFYPFAGSDKARLTDLQSMLDQTAIRAILCLRGGYGLTRIQDRLDFTAFRQAPKWIVGFSDITALHLQLHRQGYASLHAAMPSQFHQAAIVPAIRSLRSALWGDAFSVTAEAPTVYQTGIAEGVIVGGNLSLLVNALGTPSAPDTHGKILLLEEVGEAPYVVDRMLVQLRRSGTLDGLRGCIIGSFTNQNSDAPAYDKQIKAVLNDHFNNADFPVAAGFPVGHTARNEAILLGVAAQLVVWDTGATVRFAARTSVL